MKREKVPVAKGVKAAAAAMIAVACAVVLGVAIFIGVTLVRDGSAPPEETGEKEIPTVEKQTAGSASTGEKKPDPVPTAEKQPEPVLTGEKQTSTVPAEEKTTEATPVFASVEEMKAAVEGLYWSDADGSILITFIKGEDFRSDSFHDEGVTAANAEARILADLGKDPDEATLADFYRITDYSGYQGTPVYDPKSGTLHSGGDGGGRFYYLWEDGRLVYYAFNWDKSVWASERTDTVLYKLSLS